MDDLLFFGVCSKQAHLNCGRATSIIVRRHPYRPAHIHLLISAEGFVPLTTHLFVKGDKYLDSDAVFGTKDSLVVDFARHDSPEEAASYHVMPPFYTVEYTFVLKPV